MNLVIRAATPSDIPELVAVEKDSFASPHWQADDFLKHECRVAEIDAKIAGFLVSRDICPANGINTAQREILNVAVAPLFRRRGIATALIQLELRRPAEFFLEVRESNFAAQELYRRFGFVEIGRRPQYYDSPGETAIVMNMK